MSKSERVDEIAPIIAGAARLVGSLAKRKAMKKAKEKLLGQNKDPQVDQALNREMEEALHTAYKNLIMEMMQGPGTNGRGFSPQEVASAGMNAAAKKADARDARIQRRRDRIAARQKQQGPSLLSRTSERVKKFMADRTVAQETKAIKKGKEERRSAEQKKYLASKAAERSSQIAQQKRVAAFGKNRGKVEARRLKDGKATKAAIEAKARAAAKETAKTTKARAAAEETAKKTKARAAAKETAKKTAKEAENLQNRSQRGTDRAVVGRGVDRFKDRVVDFATAKGLRTGLSNVRQSINRGRAAAKAGRERIQFQHTEYQRIGSIIAEKSAAWTRKAGKNPSGGLNAKGVASYKAKNPGSKLKTAVTTKPSKLKKGSKAAKRRSSFCSRMSGMRKRQNPKNNTGKDRLSLSLKKWNC
jgi:hypothetical protein